MIESIRVSGLSEDDNRLVNHLLRKLGEKMPKNLLRETYYDSKRVARQVSSVVPPAYHRMGVALGWAAKTVDGLANRCNLDGFVWTGGDLEDAGLPVLLDENRFLSEVRGGITTAMLYGPSFIVNTAGGEGEPESLIHFRSAKDATGDWNHRTRRMDNLLSVVDRDGGEVTEFVLYQDGVTTTCVKDGSWSVLDRHEHGHGVPVERLAYRPETKPFGQSRLTRSIMYHQDAALRTLIRAEGHMDVYSFPEMWMLGADESIFKNADGTLKQSWQVMLGRIKGIPDDEGATTPRADVKQFQAASPAAHLEWLNVLAKQIANESNLPVAEFALTDYANPTSEGSLVEGRDGLIADAEAAMYEFGFSLNRAVRRGLAIQNGEPDLFGELRGLQTKWRSPLHLSRAAEADAGSKQVAAAPWLAETEVGLELLGLSEQQIERALAERRRTAGRAALEAVTGSMDAAGDAAAKADALKKSADAVGVLVRTGVDPDDAATRAGLDGLKWTGAVPVALRIPENQSGNLEEK